MRSNYDRDRSIAAGPTRQVNPDYLADRQGPQEIIYIRPDYYRVVKAFFIDVVRTLVDEQAAEGLTSEQLRLLAMDTLLYELSKHGYIKPIHEDHQAEWDKWRGATDFTERDNNPEAQIVISFAQLWNEYEAIRIELKTPVLT